MDRPCVPLHRAGSAPSRCGCRHECSLVRVVCPNAACHNSPDTFRSTRFTCFNEFASHVHSYQKASLLLLGPLTGRRNRTWSTISIQVIHGLAKPLLTQDESTTLVHGSVVTELGSCMLTIPARSYYLGTCLYQIQSRPRNRFLLQ